MLKKMVSCGMSLAALCLLLSTSLHAQSLDYQSIWTCDNSKPNWYCDEEADQRARARPMPKPRPMELKPELKTPKRIEIKNIKTSEEMRVELKRREDVAVMTPSESNIKDYLELWQVAQEKGAVFADTWRRVVWQNPELDYSLKRPANNAAINIYDNQTNDKEDGQLAALAKEHGLIFFFRSDCQYCHAMAPTVKLLSEKYGMEVLGVSIDGGGIPEFPRPTDGRAQAAKWGIEKVPALFIASKTTADKAAIGFGMMALSEIKNRIFVLTGSKPGENF